MGKFVNQSYLEFLLFAIMIRMSKSLKILFFFVFLNRFGRSSIGDLRHDPLRANKWVVKGSTNFKVNPNLLISCYVHIELSSRIKIANPTFEAHSPNPMFACTEGRNFCPHFWTFGQVILHV